MEPYGIRVTRLLGDDDLIEIPIHWLTREGLLDVAVRWRRQIADLETAISRLEAYVEQRFGREG